MVRQLTEEELADLRTDTRRTSDAVRATNERADQIIAELLSEARESSEPPRSEPSPAKRYSADERADILAQLSASINASVLARTHGIPVARILGWARRAGIKFVDGRTRSGQWKR